MQLEQRPWKNGSQDAYSRGTVCMHMAYHLVYLKNKQLCLVHVCTAADHSHTSCYKVFFLACKEENIHMSSFPALPGSAQLNIPNKAHPPSFLTTVNHDRVVVTA